MAAKDRYSDEAWARRVAYAKEYQRSDAGYDGYLRRRYGITIDEWNEMFKSQDGLCAVCERPLMIGKSRPHVDHDHDTGRVRGLLCAGCNHGLAFLDRDDDWLLRAQAYRLGGE